MKHSIAVLAALALLSAGAASQAAPAPAPAPAPVLLLQSDFGLQDGSVASLKGVAYTVSPALQVVDITHLIPPFSILDAAYRLRQVAPFWPAGSVFVSIVDPGVGTARRSVVMKTKTGQYFVTPDNGTLTFVAELFGVAEVREIDETVNRRPGSQWSATFHGRDVYVYTAARLAAGVITFEQVGPSRDTQYVAAERRGAALHRWFRRRDDRRARPAVREPVDEHRYGARERGRDQGRRPRASEDHAREERRLVR